MKWPDSQKGKFTDAYKLCFIAKRYKRKVVFRKLCLYQFCKCECYLFGRCNSVFTIQNHTMTDIKKQQKLNYEVCAKLTQLIRRIEPKGITVSVGGEIGEDANVGAGSITCNYDGEDKHLTRIGNRAFIGSDTMMVAPVNIGDDAVTGAGSVISRDVPDGSLAIERTEQKIIRDYRKNRKGNSTGGK